MRDLKELEKLTLQWGLDRKITVNGTVDAQVLKFGEELFKELLDPSADYESTEDALGDLTVVLTMIVGIKGVTLGECLGQYYLSQYQNNRQPQPRQLQELYGDLCHKVCRKVSDIDLLIGEIMASLLATAETYGTKLNICWSKAYDEIKDRKGELTSSGVFVKQSDLISQK